MPEENVLFARETDAPAVSEDTSGEVQASKYLICISDGLLYGVDAEQVETIITDHTITRLPRVPHYVRGIINLRGQLIPIIDMRLRLGKMPEDEHCIMVVNVENNVVGLLVDGVELTSLLATDHVTFSYIDGPHTVQVELEADPDPKPEPEPHPQPPPADLGPADPDPPAPNGSRVLITPQPSSGMPATGDTTSWVAPLLSVAAAVTALMALILVRLIRKDA